MTKLITIDQLQFIEVAAPDTTQDEIRRLQDELAALKKEIASVKATPKPAGQSLAPSPPCTASRRVYTISPEEARAIRAENLKTPYGALLQSFIDHGVPAPPWEWGK